MPDIAVKSTGTLIDELVTNAWKTGHAIQRGRDTSEFDARFALLRDAIDARIASGVAQAVHSTCVVGFVARELMTDIVFAGVYGDRDPRIEQMQRHVQEFTERIGPSKPVLPLRIWQLCCVSKQTWLAQEHVMGDSDDTTVASAARTAQQCNARRTDMIRQIDQILGEAEVTITTKTYG